MATRKSEQKAPKKPDEKSVPEKTTPTEEMGAEDESADDARKSNDKVASPAKGKR